MIDLALAQEINAVHDAARDQDNSRGIKGIDAIGKIDFEVFTFDGVDNLGFRMPMPDVIAGTVSTVPMMAIDRKDLGAMFALLEERIFVVKFWWLGCAQFVPRKCGLVLRHLMFPRQKAKSL